MKRNRKRLSVLVHILTVVFVAALFSLFIFAEDADDETISGVPSDVATDGDASSEALGYEDEGMGNFVVGGDEDALDVETYEGDVDDADGEPEEDMSLADEGDTDSEEEYQAPVEAAIPVDLSDPVTDIGETKASLSFVIKKSDEQQMTGYRLKLTRSTDGTSAEGAAELQDEGYLRYNITADTSGLLPGYAMTPDTEYKYVFSVTVDGKAYSKTGSFRTAAAAEQPVKVVRGDINADGKVNNKDSMILARYLAKWDGYEEQIVSMEAADVNKDGKVNNKDRMILARYLAKWDGYAQYFE